jgi:ATP-binding cassette, subfamily B, bacterial PglK
MINLNAFKNGWMLLLKDEKSEAVRLLFIVSGAAIFNAAMIGSVWPFLNLVGDPSLVLDNEYYNYIYSYFSFTTTGDFIIFTAAFSLLVIIISTFAQVYRVYAVSKFALMKSHTLSHRLFSLYINKSYEFHTMHNTSVLETHILSETQHVVMQLFRPAANLIAACISVLLTISVLLVINLWITVTVLLVFGSFYLVVLLITKRAIVSLGKKRHEENKKCFNLVSESLDGIKELKANRLEDPYLSRFFLASKKMADSQVRAQVMGESPNFFLQGVTFGGMIVLAILLLDLDQSDASSMIGGSLPLLGVFAFAGQRLIPELQRIYQGYTQLQYANKAAQTLSEILMDEHLTPQDTPDDERSAYEIPNTILFDNVSYMFPSASNCAVSNLSFEIFAGQKIGIVGTTGSGKTTLVDLLLGLLQPSSGSILVNNIDLAEKGLQSWQDNCSYLPQDVFLLDGTIKDNITFSDKNDIDVDRLSRAIESSELLSFLQQRSEGLNSWVGERGVQLSGGQRQRVGIARVLYKKSKVIILDEATSALDNLTERSLLSSLFDNTKESTIFIIAHRLESVRNCDKILVMEEGRLVGEGDWDSLLASNSQFRLLVQTKSLKDTQA